jgi:hypothetical protein
MSQKFLHVFVVRNVSNDLNLLFVSAKMVFLVVVGTYICPNIKERCPNIKGKHNVV